MGGELRAPRNLEGKQNESLMWFKEKKKESLTEEIMWWRSSLVWWSDESSWVNQITQKSPQTIKWYKN